MLFAGSLTYRPVAQAGSGADASTPSTVRLSGESDARLPSSSRTASHSRAISYVAEESSTAA